MAKRFAMEGAQVLLAAKMTEKMRGELHESIELAGGENVSKDDVHLILEYKRNEQWGQYKAPRANR